MGCMFVLALLNDMSSSCWANHHLIAPGDSRAEESGCTGVYRSDPLHTLMQEERAYFRVDAILAEKAGLTFCLFEFSSVWGVV
jgi:hypothetical protein